MFSFLHAVFALHIPIHVLGIRGSEGGRSPRKSSRLCEGASPEPMPAVSGDELTELLSQGNLILGSGIAPGGCEVSAPNAFAPFASQSEEPQRYPNGSVFPNHISSKGTSCTGRADVLIHADSV